MIRCGDTIFTLQGHVAQISLHAAQESVSGDSGCATDGATARTERMNNTVTTPPILRLVSPSNL